MFKYTQSWRYIYIHKIACRSFNSKKYIQGFSAENGEREYFYYIDHQGQLFMDGTKIRNFVTCFKDRQFLAFFFKRLKTNNSGKYSDDYPYISQCGPEMNYVRCESRPIVFTDLFEQQTNTFLTLNGIGDLMTVPFQPNKLCMLPLNGRVYHPAAEKVGGVGILKTSLAVQFSSNFLFLNSSSENDPPTHFSWKGEKIQLDNSLLSILRHENYVEEQNY